MARELIWTKKATVELFEILEYWLERNKSTRFGRKLNTLINEQLELLSDFPKIGRATDLDGVYVKKVHKYLLYYEFNDEIVYVLSLRHGSRDSQTLKIKKES